MSQSEDYLDGLLNSINKAKTDAMQVQQEAEKRQQEVTQTRKAVSPEEDFLTATGIDASEAMVKTAHPYLRKVLSEEDFLRKFEEELASDDVDLFISNFEQEIDDEERIFQETGEVPDSENIISSLLDKTDKKDEKDKEPSSMESVEDSDELVAEDNDYKEEETSENIDDLKSILEEEDVPENLDEEPSSDSIEENSLTDDDTPISLPDDDDIDLSDFALEDDSVSGLDEGESDLSDDESIGEDDLGFSLDDASVDVEEEPLNEEPMDESLKEFLPDEMDALDEAEFGDGDEPDLSGEGDLDLENLLSSDGDDDLSDIQSILNGDEVGTTTDGEIDESAEEASQEEEDTDDKGKKKKKKKEKKPKGEKKPNPLVQKLLLILFGPPDEHDIAEAEEIAAKKAGKTVEITYDEEGNPIVPEEGEEGGKKKKKEKKEKPPKEKKEKKEKPPKPPKPKKEKKPKEPDNSPKIPISIIATFLLLSISIIAVVIVGMSFTGLKRHMAQAEEYFEAENYIAAYEKINGFDFSDEDVALLRNQARTLADLQLCQQQYEAFIEYEQYNYALDSLIIGVGRYEKYKDDAVEYGISEKYEEYGNTFITELQESFGLSEEEALDIYNQPNRHYYTIELRKVLRSLGLPDL